MNHVFLSGIVESMPITVSASDQTLHVRMNLTVSHRTAAGIEKKEQYPISAWRGIATRMVELIRPGAHVSIKGYLSQKQTSEGTLEKFGGQFVTDLICFLRGDFTGLEGLTKLIGDHFTLNPFSGIQHIGISRKHEFLICGFRSAGIRGDQPSVICFFRALCIIDPCFQALHDRLALVYMHRNDSCSCYLNHQPKESAPPEDDALLFYYSLTHTTRLLIHFGGNLCILLVVS